MIFLVNLTGVSYLFCLQKSMVLDQCLPIGFVVYCCYYKVKLYGMWQAELCDKRWFGFEIEYLLIARFFRIQYQNQYLFYLEVVTDIDINIVQWVIFEFETPFSFSLVGP